MAADVDLGFWVWTWTAAALFLMYRHWRRAAGAGLMFSYVLTFAVLHWFGPLLHLLPWHSTRDLLLTVEGMRQSTVAILALVAGSEIVAWSTKATRLSGRNVSPQTVVDDRLVRMYFFTGLVLYAVVTPLASRVASLTAFVSTGSLFIVVGMGLFCWNAWVRGERGRFWGWLALSTLWPVVTLVGEGFLGFGMTFLLMILAFVASFYRPRWRVVVAGALLAYVGLSVYVTYMRDRQSIRSVVWGRAALTDRFASVGETFREFEWFDPRRTAHLDRVEARLNQNFLIGASVYYLSARPGDFAHGSTLTNAMTSMIPRALWPDKPVTGGSGDMVTTYTGIRFAQGTSVGIGQVMEAYVNFGTDGVVIVFVILGALIVFVDRWSRYRLHRGDGNGFVVCYLPGLCLLQIGGSLSEVVAAGAASFAMAFMLNRIAVYKRWATTGAGLAGEDDAMHQGEHGVAP